MHKAAEENKIGAINALLQDLFNAQKIELLRIQTKDKKTPSALANPEVKRILQGGPRLDYSCFSLWLQQAAYTIYSTKEILL